MITSALQSAKREEVIGFAHICSVENLAGLQAEVQNLTEQPWVPHVNERDYDGEWDVLPLRCERQHVNAHPVLQAFAIEDGQQWWDLPRLQSCPILKGVLDSLKCPLKSVRLMRLRAGANILPHRDPGLGIEYGEARLHLPIATNEDVIFTVDGSRVPMAAGELWYINADLVHAVRNQGSQDRINLVIDCRANDWLRDQISPASASRLGGGCLMERKLNEHMLPHYRQLLTDPSQLDACREINNVPALLQHLKTAWNQDAITDNELLNSLHWCNQQQLNMDVDQLSRHWLPHHYDAKTRSIQWCLPTGHATEPFHDEYIGRCQRSLLINQFVRPRTSLNALIAETRPLRLTQPAGFIFHLSRCGSTLLSGCLSELGDTCVLSESQLLTDILLDGSLSRDDKARVLPQLIHLQGSSVVGRTKIIIKWNAWDIFHWHLLRELYSQAPVILLVRNPLEILASHARQAGRHMSGDKSLSVLHPVFAEHHHGGMGELRIQVLRELMAEMLNVVDELGVELIDYDALNETRIQQAAEHFGLTATADERLRVRCRMAVHSKQPDKVFQADGQMKQRKISDHDRGYAWSKLSTTYQQLIAKRTTTSTSSEGVEALL